jgi:hypothetical protein
MLLPLHINLKRAVRPPYILAKPPRAVEDIRRAVIRKFIEEGVNSL